MLATKCVNGKVFKPTKRKQELLQKEYDEFNRLAKWVSECKKWGIDEFMEYSFVKDKFNLYSLTKQQALRNCKHAKAEQPLIICHQSCRVEFTNNELTPLWLRISVANVWGGIWLPIKTGQRSIKLLKNNEPRGIKIMKRDNNFYVSITIQKEVEERSCSNTLAVDLGEKYMAVVSGTAQKQPLFLGREVRGIRRHYAWLRKELQKKGLIKKVKELKNKERNKVENVLHVISKKIVEVASITNSAIILGDMSGIRDSAKGKGKRFNRIVSNMPFHKLTTMIEYKAKWKGIPVKKISEAYTSQTCHKCGHKSKSNRRSQGHFKCTKCGWEANADYNGSLNILKKSLGYNLSDGVQTLNAQEQNKKPQKDDSVSMNKCAKH